MFDFNYKQSRRGFLAATGVAVSVGLAGCADDEGDDENTPVGGDSDTPDDGENETDANTTQTDTSSGIGSNITDTPDGNESVGGNESDDGNESSD